MISWRDPLCRWFPSFLLSSGLLLGVLLTSGQAQVTTTITPDGTLGTTVTQRGTIHDITGGTRPGNGPNLFHSFDRFSVGTNDTARFSGPTGIVNILNRVTGGQQSVIDGRLQSTIPGANLYLLNPSGSAVWSKCQPGHQRVVSRQHGGLSAVCGWGNLFGTHRREEHADGGATGGLWIFGQHSRRDFHCGELPASCGRQDHVGGGWRYRDCRRLLDFPSGAESWCAEWPDQHCKRRVVGGSGSGPRWPGTTA